MKVTTYKGRDIEYDPTYRRFSVKDDGGNDKRFDLQEDAERYIDKCGKAKFTRIPSLKVRGKDIAKGEVTSYNPELNEIWVSISEYISSTGYGVRTGREKVDLRFSNSLYEQTESNLSIVNAIKKQYDQINVIEKGIKGLEERLEKPINKDYFNRQEGADGN